MQTTSSLIVPLILWLTALSCSDPNQAVVSRRNATPSQNATINQINKKSGTSDSVVSSVTPFAPTNFASDKQTADAISLVWDAPAASDFPIQSYLIERNGQELPALDANLLSFQDTGLTADTIYTYRIRAVDSQGQKSKQSDELGTRTLANDILKLTSPENGSTVPPQVLISLLCEPGATVTLTGDLDQSSVLFCEGGVAQTTVNFASGDSKRIYAEQDFKGRKKKIYVDINVDMLAPILIVSSPLQLALVGNTVAASGKCQDGLPVLISGTGLAAGLSAPCASSAFSANLNLSAGDGSKALLFSQVNAQNKRTDINLVLTKDTTPPAVSFTSPAANASSTGELIVKGTCESPFKVDVALEGVKVASSDCINNVFSQTLQLMAPDGNKVVSISQTDGIGLSASATRSFVLSTKLDGAALYAASCAGCHGALAQTTKPQRTAVQITAAIAAIPSMNFLSTLSSASIGAIATALGGVTGNTAPLAPANLRATAKTYTTLTLAWDAAVPTTTGATIKSYQVLRNGQSIANVLTTQYTDTALTPATTANYAIVAVDSNNLSSSASAPLAGTTLLLNPILISSPAANAVVGSKVLVSVNCASGAQVTLSGNLSAPVSFACTTGTADAQVTLVAGAGAKTITATQIVEGLSSSVSRIVTLDDTAANLSVNRPLQGALVGTSFLASGSCETGLSVSISGSGLAAAQQTTCSAGTFSVTLLSSTGEGAKALSFVQVDSVGNRVEVLRSVTRDTLAPAVAISSPAANTVTAGPLSLSGTCEAPFAVSFAIDGVASGSSACSAGTYSANLSLSGADGLKTVLAQQTDAAGNQGSASRAFSLKVVLDGAALYANNCAGCHNSLAQTTKAMRTAAQISSAISTVPSMAGLSTLSSASLTAIATALSGVQSKTPPLAPANLRTTAKTYTTISLAWDAAVATTSGATIKSYNILRNGQTIASVVAPTTTYQDKSLTPGTSYSYTLVAVDSNPLSSTPSAALSVAPSALTAIAITSPAANAVVGPTILAVVNCATGAQVTFTGNLTAPVSFSCTTGIASTQLTLVAGVGSKTITATQVVEGLTSSTSRTVTLDDKAANLTVDRPLQGAIVGSSFLSSGSCETGLPVKMSGTGLAADQQFPCNTGTYSITLQSSAGDGAKAISFSQTDAVGNRSEVLRSVTRDSIAPTIVITSPAANSVSSGTVSLTGTCEAPFAVAFKIEGISTGTTACSTGTFSSVLSLSGADGLKTVLAQQTDAAGNVGSSSRAFTLKTTVDGAALYQTYCSSCHGALASSSKKGKSASEIANAIRTIPSMTSLSTLSTVSIEAISDVLAIPATPSNCTPTAKATPLLRLNAAQYRASVKTALGLATLPTFDLPIDQKVGPFATNVTTPVSDLAINQYMLASEAVATAALARITTLLPCKPNAITNACMTTFINQVGQRIYRRPLVSTETSELLTLVAPQIQALDGNTAFKMAISAMLQSPNFLYRPEFGVANTPAGSALPLTSFELATRLSYFLTGSGPDDALLQAAAAGTLSVSANLQTQANRLFPTAGFDSSMASMISQWLSINGLESITRDPVLYPTFNPALRTASAQELQDFTKYVMQSGDRRLETLLSANFSILTDPLFTLYQVAKPAGYVAGTPVQLNTTQRSGILSQAAFLMTQAHAATTNPVGRGKVIRENFLCQTIAPPPPNIPTLPASLPPDATAKQIYANHETDPTCAACHKLMDPIGLTFENFDAIGAYRTKQGSSVIDASGQITATPATNVSYADYIGLATALANSSDVQRCFVNQTFSYGMARGVAAADSCTLSQLSNSFNQNSHDIRSLMLDIILSNSFRLIDSGTP